MKFVVSELRRAKTDKRNIFEWLHERSRSGAIAWLAAYDKMIGHLKTRADTFSEADENDDLELDVKQAFFKTRRGRVYRALFLIEDEEVFILRVRGPGQEHVHSEDVDFP
jgi:plasmid stabilization system protein ParE